MKVGSWKMKIHIRPRGEMKEWHHAKNAWTLWDDVVDVEV